MALHAPHKGGDAQVCTPQGPVMLSCLKGERGEDPSTALHAPHKGADAQVCTLERPSYVIMS